jgi:outer membrane receptor for ferrienterochelin and colicin
LRLARPDGFAYVTNVGAAHNKGVESTLAWQPNQNCALQASLTYLDAALAQTIVLGGGCRISLLRTGRFLQLGTT